MSTVVDETPAGRLGRRLITIPAYAIGFAVLGSAGPLLLAIVALRDVVRGTRLAGVRLVLFAYVFLAAEIAGLLGALVGAVTTAGSPGRSRVWFTALQTAWTRVLLGAAERLFGLRFVVEGDDVVVPGPILLFARHASIADTLLPSVFVTYRHGIRLRFVLKRELLWDPCLDVVGHRLPNAFVRRASVDSAREIALVRDLGSGLGPDEGVLIYPEGTRFTRAKRAAVLRRIAETDPDRLRRVDRLERLLPPQLGGATALLDAAPEADVVFLAHTGFDGATTLREVFDGALVGRTVRIAFWRVPAASVPGENAERLRWLDDAWGRMDAWMCGGGQAGRSVRRSSASST